MHYYKTQFQYDGTCYSGFQFQNSTNSIQNEINNALSNLYPGKITTTAASRTDTGVHALDQIVKITSTNQLDLLNFIKNLNLKLPKDIKCISIENCQGEFHPSASTTSKEYRYYFTNSLIPNDNYRRFVSNISNPLDISKIKRCLKLLIGENDFSNFYSAGSNVKSTVRTIFVCELSEINPHDIFSNSSLFKIPEDLEFCYEIRFVGNGFLKQMIRHLMSALWMVGSGKMEVDQFIELLNGPKVDKQLWKVAPPNGLFLYKIS